jgi:hypothetical protein
MAKVENPYRESGKREIKSLNSKKSRVKKGSNSKPIRSQTKSTVKRQASKPNALCGEKKFLICGTILAVLIIITAIVGVIFIFGSDMNKKPEVETVEVVNKSAEEVVAVDIEPSMQPEMSDIFNVEFSHAQVNGTSEALIKAKLLCDKQSGDDFVLTVFDGEEIVFEANVKTLGDGLYIKAVGLKEDNIYTVKAKKSVDGVSEEAEQVLEFSTPKRQTSISEIEKLLEETCGRTIGALSKDNQILFESQAAMVVMGMDISVYGRMETLTQINQVMLDYSLNSYGDFVFWNNINEAPTKESLALLKDILSVDKNIKKDNMIKPFIVSPYSMTNYSKYDHHGGQISSEDFIFDVMRNDQNGQAYFATYPYVVDTPEFQTLYSALINGDLKNVSDEYKLLVKEFGKETFELAEDDLYQAIAAKNKVFFANYCAWWLEEVAVLDEKRIYLYSESGRHSMDSLLAPTMVGFSYMYAEYRDLTGNDLTINNSYRSCEVQWDKYTRGYGKDKVLTWSGPWHNERQVVSYVPGYSNHQFAVAIDFQPAQSVFINSEEYAYLEKNASKYGFYNYALEPWHWTYLGKKIDNTIIDSTELAEPLMDE